LGAKTGNGHATPLEVKGTVANRRVGTHRFVAARPMVLLAQGRHAPFAPNKHNQVSFSFLRGMKKSGIQKLLSVTAATAMTVLGPMCFADNPIIQTKFTADPAPMAYNDTVYLYTSHDEDDATGFKMLNWMLYTSTDMVNWTDHGIIGGVAEPYKTFRWADGNNAWAPQCVHRNGKFYLYCPFPYKGQMAIGVAVADSPFGPFKDPLGKPLVTGSYDPTGQMAK